MPSINFYINPPNKKGECCIMLVYGCKQLRFRYSTKIKTTENAWSNQRVKPNFLGASEKNGILDDLENILKEIEREAIFNKKSLNIDMVRRKFQLKTGNLSSANSFFQIYEKFINDSKPSKSISTIKAYSGTKIKLLQFQKDKTYPITFDRINQNFYEDFLNYLIKDLGYLNNTVGKHIKTLKTFINYSIDREFTNPNPYLKKFKVFQEDADIIYLSEDELLKIFYLTDLPDTLKRVRDNFCFGCFTGLRFSDIHKLTDANIKGDYVEIKAEKTKDFIRVPLNDYCKDILNNYKVEFNGKPLPTGLSNQKTNGYLKELGKLAEINEINTIEKFNGSKKIIISKPKYELLSSHTARRTFVTLALEKGIRAEVVLLLKINVQIHQLTLKLLVCILTEWYLCPPKIWQNF